MGGWIDGWIDAEVVSKLVSCVCVCSRLSVCVRVVCLLAAGVLGYVYCSSVSTWPFSSKPLAQDWLPQFKRLLLVPCEAGFLVKGVLKFLASAYINEKTYTLM